VFKERRTLDKFCVVFSGVFPLELGLCVGNRVEEGTGSRRDCQKAYMRYVMFVTSCSCAPVAMISDPLSCVSRALDDIRARCKTSFVRGIES
jgi:hypothetical protein